jgi:hypothetical protein
MLSFWMAPRIWGLQGASRTRIVPIVRFGLDIRMRCSDCPAYRLRVQHRRGGPNLGAGTALDTEHVSNFTSSPQPLLD